MSIQKQNSLILLGLTAIFAVSLFGCRKTETMPEDMVAQVNDHYLRLKQVEESVPQGLPDDLALSLKKNIISRWVENEALYLAAKEEGVSLSDYDKYLLEEYRKSLLIQHYFNKKIKKDFPVSDKAIEDYYKAHKDEFRREKDEVHVVHLFMEQSDPAIFKEIRNADDLMPIIKKYYLNEKSTVNQPNGDLGYVAIDQFPESLARVLKRMKTGTISRPIKTREGYHFFQLIDRQKKGTIRSLDLVRDQIVLRLKKQRHDKLVKDLVQQAKQKVQIQTYLSKIQ